jgi:hypothetical protein
MTRPSQGSRNRIAKARPLQKTRYSELGRKKQWNKIPVDLQWRVIASVFVCKSHALQSGVTLGIKVNSRQTFKTRIDQTEAPV